MTIQEKVAILRSYTLFAALTEAELEDVARHAEEKVYLARKIIMRQHEPSSSVYVIYKGLMKSYVITEEGKIVPMRTIGAMDIVGEVEVIDNHLPTVTIETLQETHALLLTKEYCKTLLKKPSFTLSLLNIVAWKLRNANKREEKQVSLSLKERTWDILQTLSQHFPNKEISLSQEELALLVGATRARITEILNGLGKQKLIALSHRKIRVL